MRLTRQIFRSRLQVPWQSRCTRKGISVLLEPIMKVDIITPVTISVTLAFDISARRGQIQGMDAAV